MCTSKTQQDIYGIQYILGKYGDSKNEKSDSFVFEGLEITPAKSWLSIWKLHLVAKLILP